MKKLRQCNIFQFEEAPFSEGAKGVSFIVQEVLLLVKCLQTKPQVKCNDMKYFAWHYTIIKILSDGR